MTPEAFAMLSSLGSFCDLFSSPQLRTHVAMMRLLAATSTEEDARVAVALPFWESDLALLTEAAREPQLRGALFLSTAQSVVLQLRAAGVSVQAETEKWRPAPVRADGSLAQAHADLLGGLAASLYEHLIDRAQAEGSSNHA